MSSKAPLPLRSAGGALSPERQPRSYRVETWGCQMNVYDSGRMSDVLAPLGYVPTPTPEGADMVILNTCHIRDRAAEKRAG